MPLNHAQKQAVEYLEGPLLVLAGPGTGKTQLLSAKVEYILKNTDTNPSNILCLTYTDAGANNMRTRLTSMIGRAANEVSIHTYHAFGSDLLAQYKNYATEFDRQLDQTIDTVTQYKLIKNIQQQLPALDIMKTANISDIISTISSAKSARLTAAELTTIANHNQDITAELNDEIPTIMEKLIPRMPFYDAVDQVYRPLLELFLKYASPDPVVDQIEREVNIYARELDQVIKEQESAEKPKLGPLSKWKDANLEKDENQRYRLKNRISNLKLESLAEIMRQYDEYLRENGLFDFADMIEESIRILKEDAGFRATLSERYQYILLDEFQDTNTSQFELIHLISGDDSPTIMAVGDDDQAIFAFQGANASNLLDFQRIYNAKIITLTENYRSTQEILDSSHKIADQISDSFAKQHHINKILTSVRNDEILGLGETGRAALSTRPSGPSPWADGAASPAAAVRTPTKSLIPASPNTLISRHEFPAADAEYFWVAQQIRDLIANGEEQSEIAIITPKHKYITPLLPYLKAHPEINIAYEKRENILEDPAIHQLSLLARFIYEISLGHNPSEYLLEICSFPCWGLDPLTVITTLHRAKNDSRHALEYLMDSEDEKLQTLARFFATLATHTDEPLELLLNEMVGNEIVELAGEANSTISFTSPFLSYYTANDSSAFHLYELLSVLREHIKSHTTSDHPKLADFITFLDDYEEAGEAIINTSPYQDSTNAVQILTAHKSKGLEFRHVFLVATDNLSWGKGKGNNNLLTLPKNLIQIRHTGITEDEQLRLFFVAITRAEKTLTMTNSITDYSGKTPGRLEYLEEYEDADGQPISPLLPNPIITTHYDELSDSDKQSAITRQWLSAYQTLTPELRPILEKRLENYHLTASALTKFIDIIYAGPLAFYQQDLLRAPGDAYSPSICFGNLIHATFEAVTTQHLTDAQAFDYYKQQAESTPIPASDLPDMLERGQASLKASFKAFGDILRAPHAQAEVNLSHEHLALPDSLIPNNSIPLTGKIDHFNLNPEQKTIEVYDFKTSTFHDKNWDSHPTLFKYKLQLGFYKLLLNLSPTYRHYKVTRGHILFVSPDPADHRVHDKVYDFTSDDEQYLKNLISSVYHHIKDLDFISPDSPLAIPADDTKHLKDIKDFIKLLLETDLYKST